MSGPKKYILLIFILFLAAFFRFWDITQVPPGLYPDEAINGNNALEALATSDFKIFYPDNNGREGLFINIVALSIKIFGAQPWAVRLPSALFGFLTVLGLYLFTRQLFLSTLEINRESLSTSKITKIAKRAESIALLSSFFLATSFWHINFSRIGFRAILVPFFLVFGFYFLMKATRKTRIHPNDPNNKNLKYAIFAILSGIFLGLGFYTYIAYRAVILILGLICLIEIIKYWPRFKIKLQTTDYRLPLLKKIYIKDGWWRWDVLLLAIIIVVLPLGIYFWQNPNDFFGRAGGVSIFSAQNPLKELLKSSAKTLGMFHIRGDCNWRHHYACWPQLNPLVGILFLFGLAISIKKVVTRPLLLTSHYSLLIAWFIIMLLPAIATIEGMPHALRSIGAIPVVYIFAGLGGAALMAKIKNQKSKKFIVFGFGCFCILLISSTYYLYFVRWAQNPNVFDAFSGRYMEIGEYLNSLPAETPKYMVVNADGVAVEERYTSRTLPMPAQTVMFMTNSFMPESRGQKNIHYLLPEEFDKIEMEEGAVVVWLEPDT